MDRVSSVVRPELKRRQLVKGTALALLGMAILGSCTLFLSIQALNLIGLPAFFLGVALICLGLIPLSGSNGWRSTPTRFSLMRISC